MTGLSDGRGFGYQPQRTPILCVRARGPTYSNGAVGECVCACTVCLIPIQHNAGPSDNTNSPGGLRTGGPQLGPRGSSSSRRRQGWRSESTRQGRLRGRRAVARGCRGRGRREKAVNSPAETPCHDVPSVRSDRLPALRSQTPGPSRQGRAPAASRQPPARAPHYTRSGDISLTPSRAAATPAARGHRRRRGRAASAPASRLHDDGLASRQRKVRGPRRPRRRAQLTPRVGRTPV